MANIWHWHELSSTDIEAAGAFYRELFGWKIVDTEIDGQPYKLLLDNGQEIGGLGPAAGGSPSSWGVFLAVEDIDDAHARVKALGGRVHFGPVAIPNVGRIAACEDSTGGSFTLIQPDAA